jgi:hypothetical protein
MKASKRVATALGASGALLIVGIAGSAYAGSQAPGGNNGTIKIDAGQKDAPKANEPHVPCRFSVDFWGYDQGTQTAELIFEAHAPTGGGVMRHDTASWTTAQRTGGRHLDYSYGPIELASDFARAGIAPAKQGYHVKLTVHVTGSHGNDVKHKVFWIQPCGSTSSTEGPTTSVTYGPTTSSTVPRPVTTISG